MRLLWTGVFITGLLLIGASTYESRTTPDEPVGPTALRAEDGTPFPQPYPTPTPKP